MSASDDEIAHAIACIKSGWAYALGGEDNRGNEVVGGFVRVFVRDGRFVYQETSWHGWGVAGPEHVDLERAWDEPGFLAHLRENAALAADLAAFYRDKRPIEPPSGA